LLLVRLQQTMYAAQQPQHVSAFTAACVQLCKLSSTSNANTTFLHVAL
jgi:hypothetical protein